MVSIDGPEITSRPTVPEYFPDDFDLDTGAGQIMSDEEYIAWYKEKLEQEYEPPEKPKAFVEVEAEVGELKFKSEFSDPTVEVTNRRSSAQHSVVSGESESGSDEDFLIQAQGNRPTEIEIIGWVTKDQLDIVDELITKTSVKVISDRWTGTAIPEEVRTSYNRLFHEERGFIFETTISLLGISRDEISQQSDDGSSN